MQFTSLPDGHALGMRSCVTGSLKGQPAVYAVIALPAVLAGQLAVPSVEAVL
jgi:hypothetical protein